MTNLFVEFYMARDCTHCHMARARGMRGYCSLCFDARDTISKVKNDIPFQFKEVDISSSEDLSRRYSDDIPTVFINGKKAFKYKVDEAEFRKRIRKEFIKAGIQRLISKKANRRTPDSL